MAVPKLSSFAQIVLNNTNVPYYSQQTAIRRNKSLQENSHATLNGQTPVQLKEKRPLKIVLMSQHESARKEPPAQTQSGINGTQPAQTSSQLMRVALSETSSSPKKKEVWQEKIEIRETKPLTPPRHPASDAQSQPGSGSFMAIEMPMASEVIRKEEYMPIQAEPRGGSPDAMLEGHDQRQQADETFQALQR